MNLKLFFVLSVILLGFGLVNTAFAQIGIGSATDQKSINVFIGEDQEIHVIHEVEKSKSTRSVTLIEGTTSNIQVVDDEGNEVEHGVSGGLGGTIIIIFPTSNNVFVEYNLADVMFKKHQTTWTWHFLYLDTTTFHLPESVDVAFVNDTPVYFTSEKKFNCHGCEMVLEFVPNEKKTIQKISWEDKEFDVEIWASTQLNSFNFSQSAKTISYDFNDSERWVTLIIPLELLWNPYQAWLDDKKIFTHQFKIDDEHYGVSLKLDEAGIVSIVGTSVVPEFPMILPLMIIGLAAVILLQIKNKIILH